MRSGKAVALLAIMIATLEFSAVTSCTAGEKQNSNAHRVDKTASSATNKNSGNNSTQWQADPERGWVRADDRRNHKDQQASAKQNSEKKTKQKGNKWFF